MEADKFVSIEKSVPENPHIRFFLCIKTRDLYSPINPTLIYFSVPRRAISLAETFNFCQSDALSCISELECVE